MSKETVKKIGLWNIVGLGVGGAVGSGIFVTLGSAIAKTGRSILPITVICVFYMLLAYWYNLALSGIFVIDGGVCAIVSAFLAVPAMIREPLSHMADEGWLPGPFRKKSADGYPYFCFLLVYIIALIPILTGRSVDNAITMLMIPTMLINAYLNAACVMIPKKCPEQFAKRAIRFPLRLYNACSILGGLCAIVIAITLFKGLTAKDAVVAACIVIIPLIFSALALKRKSVDVKVLDERRAETVKAAPNADK